MKRNRILLGIILSIILLVFNVDGSASYYKYTQESGTNFYVADPDIADALEDTNQIRQIVDDLGNLLGHSKRNDLYPKDGTVGGTLSVFNNYYLKTEIDSQAKVEGIWGVTLATDAELTSALANYYLKTAIDTQAKVEAIWEVLLVNDGDLASYYLKTDINTQAKMEAIWGVSLATDSELHSHSNKALLDTYDQTNANIADAITKKHTQNIDQYLDYGGANQVVVADAKDAVDKKHASGSETCAGDVSGTVGANTVDKIKGHTVDETDIANDKILVYKTTGNKFVYEAQSGGGALTYLGLTDTPASYSGQSGKYPKVNAEEDALEFGTVDLSLYYLKTEIDTQVKMETLWDVSLANDSELHDALTLGTASGLSLDGQELSLAVNSSTSAGAVSSGAGQNMQVWKTDGAGNPGWRPDEGGVEASTFILLSDTPADYVGQGNKYVRVKAAENGLEFGTLAGGGDVLGPAFSADHSIARWNGTDNKTLQDSLAFIDDAGSVNIPTGQHYKINNVNLSAADVGAISDAVDTIKDTHLDFGSGANQIDTDDVPEGSSNLYQLTQEEVDDYVNALIKDADSVHTLITITYDDIDDAFDFVVNDDLSLYSNAVSLFITKSVNNLDNYYLMTDINTQGKVEDIWGATLATDAELAAYTPKSLFDAYTILSADTDDTPAALYIAASRIVGRAATGGIAALDKAAILGIINVEDGADVTDVDNVTTALGSINVNALADITSPGANIEDAVTKKHTSGSETQGGDISGTVGNASVNKIKRGSDASKSATPAVGDIYLATDTDKLYKCITAEAWTLLKNLDLSGNNVADLADITSVGANIEDAVTKKHSQNTDTDLDTTFEATFVKKVDTVNVLSDITSAGSFIEDAVTERHIQNTDTALGTQTEDLNMGTHKIIGVVDPINPQEAATKAYADTKVATEVDPTVDEDSELKAILVDEVTKTGDFTAGRIAKINNATGIIEQGTNTDTDVADAVTKKHTQNTDTAAGGEWDFGANSAGFTIQTAGGDGTTTINWTLGNYFKFTHGAMSETFTFNPAPTKPGHLTLIIIQDGVGGRDCTWPVPMKWLGAEPTWTDGGAGKGIVVAIVYDGTSYWSQGTPWEL